MAGWQQNELVEQRHFKVILAVADSDELPDLKLWQNQLGVNGVLIPDPDWNICRKYETCYESGAYVLIDKQMRIREMNIIEKLTLDPIITMLAE